MQDLSLGGMRFETTEELDLNSKLLFEIELPGQDDMVVFGKVVWLNKKNGNIFEDGIQFQDLNRTQLDKLKTIVRRNDLPPS